MGHWGTPFSAQGVEGMLLVVSVQIFIYLFTGQSAEAMHLTLHGTQGLLQSNGFPKGYPKENLTWQIPGIYGENTKFTLIFVWLDIRAGFTPRSCDRDFLSIYESYQGTLVEIKRYCGKRGFFKTTAYGPVASICFRSKQSSQHKGFRLIWTARRDVGKWKRLRQVVKSEKFGILQSPGFPYYQPGKTDRRWRLTLPDGHYKLIIRFIWFDVGPKQESSSCHSGVFKISQEFNGQFQVTQRFCGYRKSFNTIAYGNQFEFHFRSRQLTKRAGFRLVWYAMEGCYSKISQRERGMLRTSNELDPTSNEVQCLYKLKPPDGYEAIKVIFSNIESNKINQHRDCREGELVIKNQNGETINVFCMGNLPPSLTLTAEELVFMLRYRGLDGSRALNANWLATRSLQTCGRSHHRTKGHRERRIIGGHVEAGRWPWLVQVKTIVKKGVFKKIVIKCSGARILDNWIITAAHCVDFPAKNSDLVIEGVQASLKATRVVVHPDFEGGIQNDLALISYKDDTMVERVDPICLPDLDLIADFNETSQCYLSGWGKTENNFFPRRRRTTSVKYYGQCSSSTSIVCAGDPVKISGACDGDSGAPLMCSTGHDRYFLAGVLSHGPKRCGSDVDVYINPKHYLDWLKDTMFGSDNSV